MEGKIILSCGHEDHKRMHGIPLVTKSETCDPIDGYIKCTEHAYVCSKCYKWYVTYHLDEILFNSTEEDEYLSGNE